MIKSSAPSIEINIGKLLLIELLTNLFLDSSILLRLVHPV